MRIISEVKLPSLKVAVEEGTKKRREDRPLRNANSLLVKVRTNLRNVTMRELTAPVNHADLHDVRFNMLLHQTQDFLLVGRRVRDLTLQFKGSFSALESAIYLVHKYHVPHHSGKRFGIFRELCF